MSAEIKTIHVFQCFCGKETTTEVINALDRTAIVPMLPFGWRVVGKYVVCPDEMVKIAIATKDGKRVWFESENWW